MGGLVDKLLYGVIVFRSAEVHPPLLEEMNWNATFAGHKTPRYIHSVRGFANSLFSPQSSFDFLSTSLRLFPNALLYS